jgi:hypothetical protein
VRGLNRAEEKGLRSCVDNCKKRMVKSLMRVFYVNKLPKDLDVRVDSPEMKFIYQKDVIDRRG